MLGALLLIAAFSPCDGCNPCGETCAPDVLANAPAPFDTAVAAALGGPAAELVALTLALPLAQLLEAADLNGEAASTVALVGLAAVWPVGAGLYAMDRADVRGADPLLVGGSAMLASSILLGAGAALTFTFVAPTSDARVPFTILAGVGTLAVSAAGAAVAAGVSTAATLRPPEPDTGSTRVTPKFPTGDRRVPPGRPPADAPDDPVDAEETDAPPPPLQTDPSDVEPAPAPAE